MSAIADQVYEAVKTLPEQQAAEVLDFVALLKAKAEQENKERRKKALATLEKYRGRFKAEKFNREECYDR
jgi:hypothetical protein